MIELEVWNRTETARYDIGSKDVEGLTYSSASGVGFATCSFTVKRDPRFYYEDLEPCNIVRLRYGPDIIWEGEITSRGLEISTEVTIPIECDGTAYRLGSRRGSVSFGNEKGSTWITDHLLTDADLGFTVGRVDTNDYQFTLGIDLGDFSYYADTLDKINKANDWMIAVWEGRKFYFHPKPTTPDYIARVENGEVSLTRALENVENYLRVSYTTDGTTTNYFNWPNAGPDVASEALYRRRDGTLAVPGNSTLAQAEVVADIVLNERKRMRPNTSFKAYKVWDAASGVEVERELVRAGGIIHLENLFPEETTIAESQVINEMSTFELAQVEYDLSGGLTISPGTMGLMMEKMLARIEARSKQ